MEQSKTLNTPLGLIHFSADARPRLNDTFNLEFRVIDIEPALPPGMKVRRTRAVMLLAQSPSGFDKLDFAFHFVTNAESGAETGESLDAITWVGPHNTIVIGTEDGEAILHRMPWLKIDGDPLSLVQYRDNGMTIPLRETPVGEQVSLHYIVAENEYPEPVECSSWFAVDMKNSRLLKLSR